MRKHIRKTEYWQSYSDIMAGLLLVFALLVSLVLLQLNEERKELSQAKEEAILAQEEARKEKDRVQKMGDEYIAMEAELLAARDSIEKVVGVKAEIMQEIQTEFQKQGIQVSIDTSSGAIQFDSDLLFMTGSSVLLPAGKAYLNTAIPICMSILLGDQFADQLSCITVEGHADSVGSYERNLTLSSARAQSVALYSEALMKDKLSSRQYQQMKSILNISGRSNTNLIYNKDGTENMQASRRVELKFTLKDDEMIRQIETWFSDHKGRESAKEKGEDPS